MSDERCEPADTTPDIISRLNAACYGQPYAKIPWPHRLLHDAVAAIAAAKEREAGLVWALKKHACKCSDRCVVFEHLPADNGICLDRATASVLDTHAPGWRTAP